MEGTTLDAFNSQNIRTDTGAQNKHLVFFLTATQRECIGWSEGAGQHIAVLPLSTLPLATKWQSRDFLSQIFFSITLGNLGIQDLRRSKERTQSYESCS